MAHVQKTAMILVLLVLLMLFILTFQKQYLFLTEPSSGKVFFYTEISDGECFSVSFTHSVNKSLVTEIYQMKDGQIYLMELRFQSFGAGMPSHPEQEQILYMEGEDLVISGFERLIPDLCYVPGFETNHTLSWNESKILLTSLADWGQPVLFSVVEHPRILMCLNIYPKIIR